MEFGGAVGNMGAERQAGLRRGLPVGSLCHTVFLPAGTRREVTFILAWHFPNFIEEDYAEKNRVGQPIGHQYSQYFEDASQVLAYGAANRQMLQDRTAEFVEAYDRSSFPRWLLDASAAQLTTLVKSSWWDRQGRFGIGKGWAAAACRRPILPITVRFQILQFFPEIQQSQMRLTRDNIEIPGKIPHMMPANFSTADADHRGRIDLIPQYILLVWRDVCGPATWLMRARCGRQSRKPWLIFPKRIRMATACR